MTEDKTTYHPVPLTVGYWVVSENVLFHVVRRPRWLTRIMMRWLLEWNWVDNAPRKAENE